MSNLGTSVGCVEERIKRIMWYTKPEFSEPLYGCHLLDVEIGDTEVLAVAGQAVRFLRFQWPI